jgi:hypothetical protein
MKIQMKYLFRLKKGPNHYFYDIRSGNDVWFAVVVLQVGSKRARCYLTFHEFQRDTGARLVDIDEIGVI